MALIGATWKDKKPHPGILKLCYYAGAFPLFGLTSDCYEHFRSKTQSGEFKRTRVIKNEIVREYFGKESKSAW
jgi:hypothetical protein